jgi:hypothetical protein
LILVSFLSITIPLTPSLLIKPLLDYASAQEKARGI